MNWFKGQFWPYSPAILQVKVFYSSFIVLENRIEYERCLKYFKVKLNDLRTVYDHWLKVTGLLIKIPDSLYWWRSFTGGWCIFIKIAYFISRSYIMSSGRLDQRQQNIFGIHMVILMWFPKSNWLDRTGHLMVVQFVVGSIGLSMCAKLFRVLKFCSRKLKFCSFGDFSFSRNQSDYYFFITTYEK